MTHQEIEAAVLDTIEKAYCAKYVGKIKVENLVDCNKNIIGYKLTLGLNNIERPLTIQMEGNVDQFLKYIEKELRSRHLHYTSFYTGYQIVPEECNMDTSCDCKK